MGSASPRWITLWAGLNLDLLQFHLWNASGQIDEGVELDFPPRWGDIPTILGEFSTNPDMYTKDVCEYLETAFNLGYSGAWPWAYRAKDKASMPRLGTTGLSCMSQFAQTHADAVEFN